MNFGVVTHITKIEGHLKKVHTWEYMHEEVTTFGANWYHHLSHLEYPILPVCAFGGDTSTLTFSPGTAEMHYAIV